MEATCSGLRAVYPVEETTMTLAFRVASVTVVLALLLGGPLAPFAAAQSQAPQPDVFKETVKADPPRPEQADVTMSDAFYDISAGVMTSFLIPGRTMTCAIAGAMSIAVLALTFGTAYRAAAGMMDEGCGGKWIVRGEDLAPDRVPIVSPSAEKK